MTKRNVIYLMVRAGLVLYALYIYGVNTLSISSTVALAAIFLIALIVGGFLGAVYELSKIRR